MLPWARASRAGHGAYSWRDYFRVNTDHKVIGIQYVVTSFFFFFVGGVVGVVTGSVVLTLVVLSAVVLGVFFAAVVPGLGLAWGVALGAVISPTDAVATSIATGALKPKTAVTTK